MKKSINLFFAAAVTLTSLLLLTSCAQPSEENAGAQQPAGGKLKIVASFYPLAEFARQVGGNNVEVTNLVPAGTEPHDYEPTPKDIGLLKSADIFIYNGGGLEKWVEKISQSIVSDKQKVIQMSSNFTLLPFSGGTDPHIWLDPVNAKKMIAVIRDTLIISDPTHSEEYGVNAKTYLAQLETLDNKYKKGLSTCESKNIVTTHAAFGYLAQQYNLKQTAIAGLSPDEEPSPKRLGEISNQAKAENIHYIFFETLISPKLAETVANEIGAKTLVLNPLEGLSDSDVGLGKNYITVMEENLDSLRLALNCS